MNIKTLINELDNDKLEKLIEEVFFNQFGVLTRQGGEIALKHFKRGEGKIYLICFDINYMKQMNSVFGYYEVDERIKKAFTFIKNHLRKEDIFAANFSGDEFYILTETGDIKFLIEKIVGLARISGISVTYSVTEIHNMGEIKEKIKLGFEEILKLKKKNNFIGKKLLVELVMRLEKALL